VIYDPADCAHPYHTHGAFRCQGFWHLTFCVLVCKLWPMKEQRQRTVAFRVSLTEYRELRRVRLPRERASTLLRRVLSVGLSTLKQSTQHPPKNPLKPDSPVKETAQ
jgi:hypothetical protein